MHPRFLLTSGVLLLGACTTPVTGNENTVAFGQLAAKLNGESFVGSFGPDSTIALYNPIVGQIQIEGDKRVSGQRPLVVRLQMRCTDLPKLGSYPIGNPFSPVAAEAFLNPSIWDRVWPLHRREIRSFISDSMPPGRLELESIDTTAGVIKGRFAVKLRSFNRAPAETLDVRGAFFGGLRVTRRLGERVPRWAPEFNRDCERIRNAVSM
jgi:hypothetical protein